MQAIPIVIETGTSSIAGILRTNDNAEKLVILLPAATGTRIGPQRIYVEIATTLLEKNIASLAVDIPPQGDSYDDWHPKIYNTYREYLMQLYEHNLDKIMQFFATNYEYKEFIILTISVGCLPVLKYAESRNLSKAILLAPNLLDLANKSVNKKNLRSYREKLFLKQTWKKIFSLQLNLLLIFKNVFNLRAVLLRRKQQVAGKHTSPSHEKNWTRVLVVLGEKDQDLLSNRSFWKNYYKTNQATYYTEKIINGADHSFFGWQFKTDVKKAVTQWTTGVD